MQHESNACPFLSLAVSVRLGDLFGSLCPSVRALSSVSSGSSLSLFSLCPLRVSPLSLSCLSLSDCLSARLPVCPSVRLSVCPSACMPESCHQSCFPALWCCCGVGPRSCVVSCSCSFACLVVAPGTQIFPVSLVT